MNSNGHSKSVLFGQDKLRALTARDMNRFFDMLGKQDFVAMSELFSRVIVQTPDAWGEPNKMETYEALEYLEDFKPLIQLFVQETATVKPDDKPIPVKFNFHKLTARETTRFFAAARKEDYAELSAVFAKVITECPLEWGKPDDPETYLNRPYGGEFLRLVKQFSEDLTSAAKN